jgi:hypothetical protein
MRAALRAHHAQPAHAEPREPGKLGCAGIFRHQRNAAKAIREARERVGEQLIVTAIAAGTDDDGAIQPELVLQGDEGLGQGVMGGIGAVRRERIFGGRDRTDGCGRRKRPAEFAAAASWDWDRVLA